MAVYLNMVGLKLLLKSAWPAVFLGLIAAILFNLAFPGGPFPWIAWVSMLPIMILLKKEDRSWVVCLGWSVYGIFFWLGAVYWLYFFMRFVLYFNLGIAILLLFLCILISAVPYIVVGYVASKFSLFKGRWGALKLAALITAFIALWPVPFPGDLSMSFYRIPIFTQIADIGGGHFILFIIIWVNGLITQGVLSVIETRSMPQYIWISLIGIFAFVIGYGYFRLNQSEKLYKNVLINEFVRIGYVQPNLPGSNLTSIFGDYFPSNEQSNDLVTTAEITSKLVESVPRLDLIAWPETTDRHCNDEF